MSYTWSENMIEHFEKKNGQCSAYMSIYGESI